MESLKSRIMELEAKLCLSDDLLETLNHTVFRQQEQITQLQQQLRLIWQQLQTVTSVAEPRDLREEIPPHY